MAWQKIWMCRELNIHFHSPYHSNKKVSTKKGLANIHQHLLHNQAAWPMVSHCSSTIQEQFRRCKTIFLNCLMGYCKEAKSFPSHKSHYRFHSKALLLFQHTVCNFLVFFFCTLSSILVWINISQDKCLKITNFVSTQDIWKNCQDVISTKGATRYH